MGRTAAPQGATTGISLNPEQRAAVEHGEGPLLVLAGAGSGKTRVLTARVARLLRVDGVAPERILAVTFTNRAAGEMRARIEALAGGSANGVWIGTFHSIAARILRREPGHAGRDRAFTIYDEDDSLRALKEAMQQADIDPGRWSPSALRWRISSAKNALVGPDEYAPAAFDLASRRAAEAYPIYQRLLRARNAYDFDDLLFETVRLLEMEEAVGQRYADRFLHVLVDEYQDTNHAQYRMVRALGRGHGNVCVVGDDDQSIYGWRGADIRNILDFERDFPGAAVVRLERNYRSTGRILEAANAVIANNANRKPKTLRTQRGQGTPVRVVRLADERQEAAWTAREVRRLEGRVRTGDCAVLYRTNAQSRAYEEAFRRAGMAYRIVGGVPFYERREVKDVLAYLRLAVNPADDLAFQRAVAWPRRGVGAVTLERLAEAARAEEESLLAAAARAGAVAELPTAGARGLREFAERMRGLSERQQELPAREALEECLRRFGLATALAEEEDGAERLENVAELVAAAAAFDPAEVDEAPPGASELELYLQSIALRSDIDDAELSEDAVTLMTLHNAKGLEFPLVFVGGLEEGLFPLTRALDQEGGLEEERRLFYVGVTRARDRLYLTHADRRWRAGMESRSDLSGFLEELPEGDGVERRRAGRWSHAGGRGRVDGRGGSAARRSRSGSSAGSNPWEKGAEGTAADAGSYFWRRRVGETKEASDSRYDFSESQVPLELSPGALVIHPRFGEGRIVTITGQGKGMKAEIDFGPEGRKKVMVAYAGLRPA